MQLLLIMQLALLRVTVSTRRLEAGYDVSRSDGRSYMSSSLEPIGPNLVIILVFPGEARFVSGLDD